MHTTGITLDPPKKVLGDGRATVNGFGKSSGFQTRLHVRTTRALLKTNTRARALAEEILIQLPAVGLGIALI